MRRSFTIRLLASGMLAMVLVAASALSFAPTAKACSCATPSDIGEWVDESQAAFVGTLVDKRAAGVGNFAQEAIYTFEVETWVKGDLGDRIEVRSAADGAGCGFEFWDEEQRTGAVIYEEGGELHGGLCSQIDPDVLLAAMEGPIPSATGIGHLLTGFGWSSPRLGVIDSSGGFVLEVSPPGEQPEFSGTQHLDVCPEGNLMVQTLATSLVVWDLRDLSVSSTHDLSELQGGGWVSDVSCRDAEAGVIWMVAATDFASQLVQVLPEVETLLELPGNSGRIGSTFVVSFQDGAGSATWVDIETGDTFPLAESSPDVIQAVYSAPHPTRDQTALLTTVYTEDEPVESLLSIVGPKGEPIEQFEIPWEAYTPTWLDEERIAVVGYDFADWDTSLAIVFDVSTGESHTIEGWAADDTIADGNTIYGTIGGEIVRADLESGEMVSLATLPTQEAGPLVLLTSEPTVEPGTSTTVTETTTPPLVAPGNGGEEPDDSGVRIIAVGVILAVGGLLTWLALRRPEPDGTD